MAEDERTPETTEDIVFVSEGVTEVRKDKKCAADVVELMFSKRSILPSQYIVFPYTAEAKRRTFMDGTFPNIFHEVDLIRHKAFDECFNSLKSK